MLHVSPQDLAAKFPELLEQLRDGEELLIEVEGKVVAKVSGLDGSTHPNAHRLGFAKGTFKLREDFDEPLEDFAPYQ